MINGAPMVRSADPLSVLLSIRKLKQKGKKEGPFFPARMKKEDCKERAGQVASQADRLKKRDGHCHGKEKMKGTLRFFSAARADGA